VLVTWRFEEHESGAATLATAPRFVLVAWHSPASPEPVRWLSDHLVRRFESDGLRPGSLSSLHPKLSPPDPETKEAFRALVKRTSDLLCAHAVAFEAKGISGSLIRTILRTTGVLLRPPYPQRIFADAFVAARWLHPEVGREGAVGMALDELVGAVHRITLPRA